MKAVSVQMDAERKQYTGFQRTLLYINLNRQNWRLKIRLSSRKLFHLIIVAAHEIVVTSNSTALTELTSYLWLVKGDGDLPMLIFNKWL